MTRDRVPMLPLLAAFAGYLIALPATATEWWMLGGSAEEPKCEAAATVAKAEAEPDLASPDKWAAHLRRENNYKATREYAEHSFVVIAQNNEMWVYFPSREGCDPKKAFNMLNDSFNPRAAGNPANWWSKTPGEPYGCKGCCIEELSPPWPWIDQLRANGTLAWMRSTQNSTGNVATVTVADVGGKITMFFRNKALCTATGY